MSKNTNHPSKSGGGVETDRDTRNEQRKDAMNKRVPMHSSSVANIPGGIKLDEKNFHYRKCADYGKGKIARYLDAGYEYVLDADGHKVKWPGGDELWLMRIPKDFWEEDQLAKRGRQIQVQTQQLKKQAELATGAVPEYLPPEQNVL